MRFKIQSKFYLYLLESVFIVNFVSFVLPGAITKYADRSREPYTISYPDFYSL